MVPVPRRRSAKAAAIFAIALMGATGFVTAAPAFDTFNPTEPPVALGDGRIHVAQNQQSAAQLLVRIQDLEDQVRTLTGQIEGLQFQLTQMQTMLQKQSEDNEFRFQQLEGGTPGKKPQAALPTDGVTPSDALPQSQQPAVAAEQPADQLPAADAPATEQPAPLADGQPLDQLGQDQPSATDDDTMGESGDPLLKGGTDRLGTIDEDQGLSLDPNRPLDLNKDGGTISEGDAKAQYEAGYEAITRGDYAFAEQQFSQFISLFPDDDRAADATNWLGEAMLQRGAYADAAEVLADGYTKYKSSKRAPDMMLKLGVALAGADKADVACRTFFTLKQRYPDLAPAFKQRLAEETQKAQCPVQ